MLKLSMKPTGWFQIGWSGEIAPGEVKPLRYFGEDLVAYRGEEGALSVLEAHCKHLGAHMGFGGKVRGDCVICPYHGWAWDSSGANTDIPYQETPVRTRLRKWPVTERHGLIFLWHDPTGSGPREGWELPDLFADFPEFVANEGDYHPCFPNHLVEKPKEPVHPQLIQENAADMMHFRHTHNAPADPELLNFSTVGARWRARAGFKSKRTQAVKLTLDTLNCGVGLSFAAYEGENAFRLILAATPIDDDLSDIRVSYFYPRRDESRDIEEARLREEIRQQHIFVEQDVNIWRHQKFVQRPVFARQDVAGYSALRKWSEQFYEAPEGPVPMRVESGDATQPCG